MLLLFLISSLSGLAQEFSLRLIVEDALGHSDTVYFGRDADCTGLIDTAFGALDLSDTPWDTSIDARFVVTYPSSIQTKKLCNRLAVFNDCYQYSSARLAIATEHWPVIVHWDSAQTVGTCEEFMGISCSDILWTGDYSCDFSVPIQIVDFRTASSALFETAIPNGEPCYATEGVPQNARFVYLEFKPQGVGIQEDDGLPYAYIWPNPASQSVNIVWQRSPIGEITLFDAMGRQVLRQQSHEQRETVDVSNLHNGLYVLQLVQGEVKSSLRIVVQH